jgi:alpha-galactosidase
MVAISGKDLDMKSTRTALGLVIGCCTFTAVGAAGAETVWLDSLDLGLMRQSWGKPQKNKSVDGKPIMIAGQKFEHGVGTHAKSRLIIELKGGSTRFAASVGVDDEQKSSPASVEFVITGDGKPLFKSGVMKGGQAAKKVDVDLKGVQKLELRVTDAGDGIDNDHADWADARFEVTGERPKATRSRSEAPYVLTPKPPAKPRINGARVFGVSPEVSFLFTIAASGDRPMTFSAKGLPDGLTLDPFTGIISGCLTAKGEHRVMLCAKNALGQAERELKIVAGDTIALTPPMGWNSWNCWAGSIDDQKVRMAADAMVSSGLINHGWTYINIDDCWEGKRNAGGEIQTNAKFPDMTALCDYVHSKGLKIGIYSSPGPKTCAGFEGSLNHEEQDAKTYAKWGIDYLKYDWCSYGNVAPGGTTAELGRPYKKMRYALNKCKRDIVYSLCQYGMGNVWEWGELVGGNCWRTTGDITDTWDSMSEIGFGQAGHEKYSGPGRWNDPDMLVVGLVGWSANLHPTNLTPNEQYTHISLWCLLCSPLLIGCDLARLDDFTLNLLTNDEVLEVSQDPLGKQAGRIAKDGDLEVWAKDMWDGSKAVGLFNRDDENTRSVSAKWSDLKLKGKQTVRDLWRQKDLGTFDEKFETQVPYHGVVLVRISPAK